MFYVLLIVAAVILVVLYKFFPRKKVFVYFCLLLVVIFSISAFVNSRQVEQEKISAEQIAAVQNQQRIFSLWYADYQKDIDALDRNWQVYYDIVKTLQAAEVYERVTYEQITELETEVIAEQIKIHKLEPPAELADDCKIILAEVIHKTQIYADAQAQTISDVKAAADPETVKDLAELNKQIKNITIRSVPAGLFTAQEISQIREKLTLPED